MGSNPGEGNNRLSFVVLKNRMEGSNERIECDLRSAIFRGTRGGSNQSSSRGNTPSEYCNIML